MENVKISQDDLEKELIKEKEFQKIEDISNQLRKIRTDLDKGLTEVPIFRIRLFKENPGQIILVKLCQIYILLTL